jgi:cyclopropane fatty-acyl-phospholipid synthase-like methyltransferase
MQHTPQSFDAKFEASDDPWQFRSRWYEIRKRALTLACLPAEHYGNVFEPGCANGELSHALAPRCDHLLATDGARRAVALARQRLADCPNVEVRQLWLPAQFPNARFDLIVFSEIGYFMAPDALAEFAHKARASLAPGGTLLACHWRRQADDCELNGDGVHAILESGLSLPRALAYVDEDIRLDVWCEDTRSVATREGLA